LKKLLLLIPFIALALGCGTQVEVPPAHVGKVLTKNGYAPETIPPSKFRLPACLAYCDRLILLQAADVGFKEEMTIFMPEDKLNLKVDVRGTLSIPTSEGIVNAIFDRLTSEDTRASSTSLISADRVYSTYGQQALRGIVRSEIVKHTIAAVLSEREAISANIHEAVAQKLAATKTPIKVSLFELADIQPPTVIVEAQQAAKEREIDIQKAEADAQVNLVKAERELEVAKKDRLVEREKAMAIAEQNKIAANSITPQLLAYRRLETAENIYKALAQSDNVVIVPADSSSFSDINDDAVLAKLLGREVRR